MPETNFIAVLVSTVAGMIIGMLWYGPLFGKKWVALMGFDMSTPEKKKEMQKKATPAYFASFIGIFITAWIMSHVLDFKGSYELADGLTTGFFMWFGFVLPAMTINAMWGNKNKTLLLIDAGHILAYMLALGAILAVWQ